TAGRTPPLAGAGWQPGARRAPASRTRSGPAVPAVAGGPWSERNGSTGWWRRWRRPARRWSSQGALDNCITNLCNMKYRSIRKRWWSMGLNLDAVGTRGEPAERSWSHKDALLYALGVGAGAADPT